MAHKKCDGDIKTIRCKILELIEKENYSEALTLLNGYRECSGNDVEIMSAESVALAALNDYDGAEVVLRKAISIDVNNVDVIYNYAFIKQLKGDLSGAESLYRKIISISDDEVLKSEVSGILENLGKGDSCQVIFKDLPKREELPDVDDIVEARKYANNCCYKNNAEVCICVLAYNNLEKYTKPCIESILKYTTDIDYELMLIDNGSMDGTFEYFKSVPHVPKRIIRINENNGAVVGGNTGLKECESKFLVFLPNDVILTKNWLSNMLRCAKSDERIGMVAAASNYVSNLQMVDLGYTDINDMQIKAELFNKSDPRKWEERLRLITLATLYRKDCLDIVGITDSGFYHDFSDDDLTFRVRRAGYKAVFCGDTFIYHAGTTVTNNERYSKSGILSKGMNAFRQKYFGIDAWEDVNNYEINLLSLVNPHEYKGTARPRILGLDVKCGTPILQLKNKMRYREIYDSQLSAFVSDAKYYIDLKTICDGEVIVDRPEYLAEHFKHKSFDYILVGKPINSYSNAYKLLENILSLLAENGHLLLKLANERDASSFIEILGYKSGIDNEAKSHMPYDKFVAALSKAGFKVNRIAGELFDIEQNTRSMLEKIVDALPGKVNKEEVITSMLTRYYLVDIVKA
jgi:GT2 family glycosyltransferase